MRHQRVVHYQMIEEVPVVAAALTPCCEGQ